MDVSVEIGGRDEAGGSDMGLVSAVLAADKVAKASTQARPNHRPTW